MFKTATKFFTSFKFSQFILNNRYPILLFSFGYILYVVLSIVFSTSMNVGLAWNGNTLIVQEVAAEPGTNQLMPGDIITHVDGDAIYRTKRLYPIRKSSYDLTILRNNQTETFTIPFSTERGITSLNTDISLLAFVLFTYATASILLVFAKDNNEDAAYVGSTLLLGGVGLLSLRGSFDGYFGTWILGHSFAPFFLISFTYISFLFDTDISFSKKFIQVFKGFYVLALFWAGLSLVEVMWFYPNGQELLLFGIFSPSSIISELIIIGLFLHIVILCGRFFLTKDRYLYRTLSTLIFFVSLGALPLIFTITVLSNFFSVTYWALNLGFVMMVFIPLGYIFTIYRNGFINFSRRMITVTVFGILLVTATFLYTIGTSIIQRYVSSTNLNSFIFALTIALFFLVWQIRAPLTRQLENFIYGEYGLDEKVLAEFTHALSAIPEFSTLQTILNKTAQHLQLLQITLFINENNVILTTQDSEIGGQFSEWVPHQILSNSPIIRTSRSKEKIFEGVEWAHAFIPLEIRQQVIGFMVASNPEFEPYLNEKHVNWLILVGNVIAAGINTIQLFEDSLALNGQLVKVREDERKKLASKIHDGPLQLVVGVTNKLELRHGSDLNEPVTILEDTKLLREASQELRDICQGLHPPMLDHGVVEFALKEAVRTFKRHHSNFDVATHFGDEMTFANDEVITAIYYITKEALNNIQKHSNSLEITVKLSSKEGKAELLIQDNGQLKTEFQISINELRRQGHFGIIGMYQWARTAGGNLAIRPTQSGLIVQLEVPIIENHMPYMDLMDT